MQVHFGLDLVEAEWPHSVVCVGTFDGVHLGHQAVIGKALDVAAREELACVVVTFDRHPAHVLAPERCPKAIASLGENLHHFELMGVGISVVLPFTRELSQTSATSFFQSVLKDKLKASRVVVGHDFAFGQGREGTTGWLEERIPTDVVPPYESEGKRVSSSAIRSAIEAGNIQEANGLLGRPFQIGGVVVAGLRLGRQLGYPTANLARSFNQVTPAHGVYAGFAETPHGTFRTAVSIGVRPAVGGTSQTIEAYLIDYPGYDLYGRSLSIKLHRHIRSQQDFESLEALKGQIARDVALIASL